MKYNTSMLTLGLTLVVGCASPAGESDEGRRRFVGEVDGTGAFVAVVIDDEALFAYVCDGTDSGVTITSWFVGQVRGSVLEASNPAGSAIEAEFSGDVLVGTFTTAQSDASPFTAAVAIEPSGLYFGERGEGSEEIWGGWIVIDGEQRGAIVDRNTGDVVGSPSIDPSAPDVDVDGEPFAYELVDEPLGEEVDEVPPG